MTVGPDRIEALVAELISIPSVSRDESRILVRVAQLMRALGADVHEVPIEPSRLTDEYGFPIVLPYPKLGAVIGTWRGSRPGPRIVVNAHVDTVPAGEGWRTDPFTATVEDGALHGLGAADAKGGLIGALAGVANAAASGSLRGSVEFHAVPDEEAGGGTGTLTCIDDMLDRGRSADLVIVCEPTSLAIADAQVGSYSVAVSISGVAAHANTKHLGASAVEAAVDLAVRLTAWPGGVDRPPASSLPPRAVNIGRIEGGLGATSVAASCELEVCVTYHPVDADRVLGEIDEIIDDWRAHRDERIESSVHVLHNVTPFQVDHGSPVLADFMDVASVNGRTVGFPAGSDGRLYALHLGAPTIIYGPGALATAHRANEFVPRAELLAHAQTIERFLTGI